jgi:hypothetical protein
VPSPKVFRRIASWLINAFVASHSTRDNHFAAAATVVCQVICGEGRPDMRPHISLSTHTGSRNGAGLRTSQLCSAYGAKFTAEPCRPKRLCDTTAALPMDSSRSVQCQASFLVAMAGHFLLRSVKTRHPRHHNLRIPIILVTFSAAWHSEFPVASVHCSAKPDEHEACCHNQWSTRSGQRVSEMSPCYECTEAQPG